MNKNDRYALLYKQVEALAKGEENRVGVLANVSAAMKEMFPEEYFWVGFYLVDADRKSLLLGPFQGSVACYTIPFGRGVCGTSWAQGQSLVVGDVESFPGHIACSSLSRSEIVVPMHRKTAGEGWEGAAEVWGVLDIDSTSLDTFDDIDRQWLERIVALL
ncbi:MAG: GAF domain-containing protein [Prevotella sp.]|nr:GAF domain-containing protein [Prevotella sp.]